MNNLNRFAIVSIATTLGLFAQASTAQGPGPRGFGGPRMGIEMGHRKVVTGAPYSADISNSNLQTLTDGNTISHVSSGHVARDSQGRTYLQENISEGPWAQKGSTAMTFISDPVAGYSYMLDSSKKIAMRRVLKAHTAPPTDSPRPDVPGSQSPNAANRIESDLGTQQINGVNATGKAITHTIPAGAIGNSQEIVEKNEVWTSPDLQIVVLSKRNDPRMGTSTYSLSNLQRAEPNAALFQVPSDYTVQDAPAFPGHRP